MFSEEETKFLKEKMVTAVSNSSGKDKSMYMNILLKLNLAAMEQQGVVQPGKKQETILESKSKVINFTNTNLKMIENTLDQTFNELKKIGIGGKIGGIKYSPKSAKGEIQLFILDDSIKADDPDAVLKAEYNKAVQSYQWSNKGFTQAHFLKKFTEGNTTFEFTGFIPKGRTYIYKARSLANGKEYRFGKGLEKKIL